MMTREQFFAGMNDWGSHRPVLWHAIHAVDGPVIECGCGFNSTPYLAQLCRELGRDFHSFDDSPDWAKSVREKTGVDVKLVDWQTFTLADKHAGVVLIDTSISGKVGIENRQSVLRTSVNNLDLGVVVMHDYIDAQYGYQHEVPKFKYHAVYDGLWGSTGYVSQTIDVTKWEIELIPRATYDEMMRAKLGHLIAQHIHDAMANA